MHTTLKPRATFRVKKRTQTIKLLLQKCVATVDIATKVDGVEQDFIKAKDIQSRPKKKKKGGCHNENL